MTNLVVNLLAEEEKNIEKERESIKFRSKKKFCVKCKNKNHGLKICKKINITTYKCGTLKIFPKIAEQNYSEFLVEFAKIPTN